MKHYGGRVDTIVFHRSPGGHSNTGRKIGQSIRQRGLKTIVAGLCVSACANMFLGGTERQFTERLGEVSPSPVLGFHGSYNRKTNEVNRTRTGASKAIHLPGSMICSVETGGRSRSARSTRVQRPPARSRSAATNFAPAV